MKFTVVEKSFARETDFFCLGEDGKRYLIDLYVDGHFGDDAPDPKTLIGKTVECELHPYLYIAINASFSCHEKNKGEPK